MHLKSYNMMGNTICFSDSLSLIGEKNKNSRLGVTLNRLSRQQLPSDDLLLQGRWPQLPSALESLTSVFGMGTGGSHAVRSPTKLQSLVIGRPSLALSCQRKLPIQTTNFFKDHEDEAS